MLMRMKLTPCYIFSEVFSILGAPSLLQSDNGGEFVNEVIAEIAKIWGTKQVHGRPYHPQAQGSVENLNKRIQDALSSWIHEAEAREYDAGWCLGIKVVQFRLNTR